MRKLTPKQVEVWLKAGFGTDDFIRELESPDITNAEELHKQLGKIYSVDSSLKKQLGRLKANDRRNRKHRSSAKNRVPIPVSNVTNTTDNAEVVSDVESVSVVAENVEVSKEPEITLESVIEKINNETLKLDKLERDHQECISLRQKLTSSCNDSYSKLRELQVQITSITESLLATKTEYLVAGTKMESLKKSISESKKLLDELELQKRSLEKISIFAYSNGKIEVNEKELSSECIPAEWTELHRSFYGDEKFDALTGSQAKQLAKLLMYVKSLDRKYEICFESDEEQHLFDEMK